MRGVLIIESVKAAAAPDLGKLRIVAPIRLTLGVAGLIVAGIATGHASLGVAAAVGAFLLGFADSGDVYPVRARVLAVTAVGLIVTQFLGALISPLSLVVIAAAVPLAFACGFAGSIGPRAQTVGVLMLSNYCVSAGNAVHGIEVLDSTIAVACGCAVELALALIGWPLGRCSGIRGELADAWRTIAVVTKSAPGEMLASAVPEGLVVAMSGIATSGVTGATREWSAGLAHDGEDMRVALATLAIHRQSLTDAPQDAAELQALQEFCDAVSVCSRGVARALVIERRKAGLPSKVHAAHLTGAAAAVYAPHQVERILAALDSAAARIAQRFPIGTLRETEPPTIDISPWRAAVTENWTLSSVNMRHAIRLAVVYPLGWAIGDLVFHHHHYWLPLTIALVARPGFGLTLGRATARTLGTLLGLGVTGGLVYLLHPSIGWLAAVSIGAALVVFIFLAVNYAFAVIFITAFVVGLFEISGDPLVDSLLDRGVATVMGGVIVVIASRIAPIYESAKLASLLADLAVKIRRLSASVLLNAEPIPDVTQEVRTSRTRAAAAIRSAKVEPRGAGLDPLVAQKTLDALLATVFVLVAAEPPGRRASAAVLATDIDPAALDRDLTAVQNKLLRLAGEEAPELEPGHDSAATTDPARQPVARAWRYLSDVQG